MIVIACHPCFSVQVSPMSAKGVWRTASDAGDDRRPPFRASLKAGQPASSFCVETAAFQYATSVSGRDSPKRVRWLNA